MIRAVQIVRHLIKGNAMNGLTEYLILLFVVVLLACIWSIVVIFRVRRVDLVLSHCIGMVALITALEGVHEKAAEEEEDGQIQTEHP